MTAAQDARRFVAQNDLGDRVGKIAADAPELSTAQLDALRGIWMSPNATKPALTEAGPVFADHQVPADDQRPM